MKYDVIKGADLAEVDLAYLLKHNEIDPLTYHIIDEHLDTKQLLELFDFVSKAINLADAKLSESNRHDYGFKLYPFGLGFKLVSLFNGTVENSLLEGIMDSTINNVLKPAIKTFINSKYEDEIKKHVQNSMQKLIEESNYFDEELGAQIIRGFIEKDAVKDIADKLKNTIVDYKNKAIIATNGEISEVEYNEDGSLKQFKLDGELISEDKLDKFLKQNGL